MPHFIDRAKPGVIAVTQRGKRFTNEANSYHDFVQEMVKACAGEQEVFAWLLCDHRALRSYGLGCVAPFPVPIGRHLRSGYLKRGASIEQLAQAIGVDAGALARDDRRVQPRRPRGRGSEVRQGEQGLQPLPGRRAAHAEPVPCATRAAPFYAIRLVVGDIGTFAGLVTDHRTRVLDRQGNPMRGLYAVGNDAASVMGGNYPAPASRSARH